MVVRITLLQSKNGNCVGALPSYERPILVHRTKIESTGRITVSIKRAPYRTSPLSPLPAPLEERFIDIRRHHRRPLPRKLTRPLPPLLDHVVALVGVVQPLQRMHVGGGIASLDHQGGVTRDLRQPTRARRDDRQSRGKRLEHREAEPLI